MSEILPDHVLEGLDAARRMARGRTAQMRIEVQGDAGVQSYPLSRYWARGFAISGGGLSRLRGLADLYDGDRRVGPCLIVATHLDDDETVFEFKRAPTLLDRPPADFAPDDFAPGDVASGGGAPIGLLPQPGG
ncbi:hypothetical protein EKE94_12620 [Mesobaculum littorinae]|uniref:Uncharacterized protein n=1 Tax=Mesobaculum littorinae TaxID=2486419 RepID=A0A438AFD9_9RHOB|nr:hypothetical protein [Mesobaculum littorinae]RVV97398.1 hypothetical protein EKE94_12620 [Mesobaculum littorinae]